MALKTSVNNLPALDATEPYDVCVIGSGPAGTIAATTLASHGVRTLLLESGNSLATWAFDSRLKDLAEYEVAGNAAYPTERTVSRLLGGNSNFWTGRCERFHPSDFEPHAYTPEGNPWPFRFEDMQPFYLRAEKTLRVRGGEPSDYAQPREAPFPFPPRPDITALKRYMDEKAGLTLDDSPTATPRKGLRFFRVQKEVLPEFLSSCYGTLVSGVTATRLLDGGDGSICGVRVQTLDGVEKVARARLYVVCCGGLQTPRLLLLSRSERWPDGVGNSWDRVGRGFNEHPSLNFYGKVRPDRVTLSPKHALGRTHQFYDALRDEGLGAIHAVVIQSWVFPNHLLRHRLADVPKHLFKILARAVRPTLYMSPTLEMKPVDGNRVTLSEENVDPFGDPIARLTLNFSEEDLRLLQRSRELVLSTLEAAGATDIDEIEQTWSRHHIGACRMGTDPRVSVVDENLCVHGCENLFLCGAEVFTTGAAVQPVLTIAALAHRLGDHLPAVLRERAESSRDESNRQESGVA